jgi:ribosomal protein S18 acetylase RimI-like enzyme
MSIVIRTATVADAALIADLSRETFLDAFAALNNKDDVDKYMSEQFSVQQLMQQVGVEGHIFLLAVSGADTLGYVFLKDGSGHNAPDTNAIEISRLYVRNAYIGTGIGKTLMDAAISTAKQLDRHILWLGTWERNHRAIKFYQSFGFSKFGEHDFILGNDVQRDWLMELVINNY